MMCVRRPEVNHVEKIAGRPRVGPCLLFTVLRVAPGPEKTGAEKHFVLVGRLLLWFCNRHHYQGPWSLYRERGRGGGKKRYVIPHGTQREGTERERDVGAWQCVCLPFFLFSPSLPTSCSSPLTPSIHSTADSGHESLRLSEWSPSC